MLPRTLPPLSARSPRVGALSTLSALGGAVAFLSACGGSPGTPAHHAHGPDHVHGHDGVHGHGHGQGPLVHRFEHAERWAKEFDDPARDAWQKPKDVVDAMGITTGMTVADIGAGTGYFEPWLSRAVGDAGSVLALDVEADMVRYMNERVAREKLANVRPAVVALDDPKLPAGSVDRVLVVDTWHHIANREAYASKVKDGLQAGGKVFVVDFKLDAKHGPPPAHRLAPDQVIRELAAAGFVARLLPTPLPEQYIVVGERP
ncbi:MAG: class I SAM-dependent methyltransferase [Polyangiaceae bacterium]